MAKKPKIIDKGNLTATVWSWERLVRDAAFNKGYNDYKAGFWDRKAYDVGSIHFQTQYERGRHYAAAGGPTVKFGRTTNPDALNFYKFMWATGGLV